MSRHFHEYIGLAGMFAAGKDTLAHFLQEKYGYMAISSGDLVRELAVVERGNVERETLQKTANEWRAKEGSDYFIRLAYERYKNAQKTDQLIKGLVVTGLRSVGEVKSMKARDALIVFVDADQRIRYERMVQRHRDPESLKSFEDFAAGEANEVSNADENQQNLAKVRELSDFVLDNSGEVDTFLKAGAQSLLLDQ